MPCLSLDEPCSSLDVFLKTIRTMDLTLLNTFCCTATERFLLHGFFSIWKPRRILCADSIDCLCVPGISAPARQFIRYMRFVSLMHSIYYIEPGLRAQWLLWLRVIWGDRENKYVSVFDFGDFHQFSTIKLSVTRFYPNCGWLWWCIHDYDWLYWSMGTFWENSSNLPLLTWLDIFVWLGG